MTQATGPQRNLPLERENPDQLAPPRTDSGTVPNLIDDRTMAALSKAKPIVVR